MASGMQRVAVPLATLLAPRTARFHPRRMDYSTLTIPELPVLTRRPAGDPAAAGTVTATMSATAAASATAPASAAVASSSGTTSIVDENGPSALLRRFLETSQRMPTDQLWNMYQRALRERPVVLRNGSVRVPATLEDEHHQLVLQALVPPLDEHIQQTRTRQQVAALRREAHISAAPLESDAPLDLSTPQIFAPVHPVRGMGGKRARMFAQRAREIISHIVPEHRTTLTYNAVLRVLSLGGRFRYMRDVWGDMVAAREQGHTQAAPDQTTCYYMMVGLVRSFEQKLQRYKVRYERELLAPKVMDARASTQAAQHVRAASLQAAHTVSMLLVDIQKQKLLPHSLTLDLAARVLRMAGCLPEFLRLLRSGFGLDLHFPDAPAPALCTPTTHTLNTALMALGEMARMPDMVVAYEVLTNPLPVETQLMFGESAPPRSRIMPNTTTFKLLVRHACTAPRTLLVSNASIQSATGAFLERLSAGPQGLATIGIRTSEQRSNEVRARRRGKYIMLAHTYVDEALDLYATQLQRMSDELGVDAPPALTQDMHTSHALANERREREQPLMDAAKSVDEFGDDDTGAPNDAVFVPPSVRVTYPMLIALFSVAQSKRSTGQLAWLQVRSDHAAALLSAEYDMLQRAQVDTNIPERMLMSLAAHATYVHRLTEGVQWLSDTVVPSTMEQWRTAEQDRTTQRNARAAASPARRRARQHQQRRHAAPIDNVGGV